MEIKFIKGNKVALGAFRKTVRKLRVAAYCRVSTDSEIGRASCRERV